jgi:hypothetical protein
MNSGPTTAQPHKGTRSLRDRVDELLPEWQSWYPSLFDAAQDLGLLRAQVCDLSSLMLSHRHASIYHEAVQAFRNQWSVEEPEHLQDDETEGESAIDAERSPSSTQETEDEI